MAFFMRSKFYSVAIFILLLLAAFSGCAVYPQVFINEHGDIYRCSSYGQGAEGMSHARQELTDCSSRMRAAGFIEVERAGAVGVVLRERTTPDGTVVEISRVVSFSPASAAGITAGDVLVSAGGQKVSDIAQAKALLFGEAGTPVDVTVLRGEKGMGFTLIRAPYTKLFPIPAK